MAALDIGASRTTAIIAEVSAGVEQGPAHRILGVAHADGGLRHGAAVDLGLAAQAVRQALGNAERMAGVQVVDVFASVSGVYAGTEESVGSTALGSGPISRADVERAHDAARARPLNPDRVLLHAVPLAYTVDRASEVQDAIGLRGQFLESKVCLVTVSRAATAQVTETVERAGYQLRELVVGPVASALAVLQEDDRAHGAVLIDLGAESATAAVFVDGRLRQLCAVPLGGQHVLRALGHTLGLRPADATRVLEEHGYAYEPLAPVGAMVPLGNGREAPLVLIAHIAHERLAEIAERVRRHLGTGAFAAQADAGVVLVGGLAAMPGIAELAADALGMRVRVAQVGHGLGGLVDAVQGPRYAAAVGVALYGGHRVARDAHGTAARRWIATPGVARLTRRVHGWMHEIF